MDNEGIKAIEEIVLKTVEPVEVGDETYAPTKLHQVIPHWFEVIPIGLTTLTGFVAGLMALIEAGEAPEAGEGLIWLNQSEIVLKGPLDDQKKRQTFIFSRAPESEAVFDRFMPVEQMLIMLKTWFVQDDLCKSVHAAISKISAGKQVELEDDGVSQSVVAKKGIKLVQNFLLPVDLMLRPYRTFREVEQPSAPFILRARGGGPDEVPEVALFNSAGESWTIAATEAVKAYVLEHVPSIWRSRVIA